MTGVMSTSLTFLYIVILGRTELHTSKQEEVCLPSLSDSGEVLREARPGTGGRGSM